MTVRTCNYTDGKYFMVTLYQHIGTLVHYNMHIWQRGPQSQERTQKMRSITTTYQRSQPSALY